jgi:hypothetical protein
LSVGWRLKIYVNVNVNVNCNCNNVKSCGVLVPTVWAAWVGLRDTP